MKTGNWQLAEGLREQNRQPAAGLQGIRRITGSVPGSVRAGYARATCAPVVGRHTEW